MLRPRVMPCLLVQDGRLVKTVKFRDPSYVGDPVNAIKIYNEKEVDELILLDIDASRLNTIPAFDVIEEVSNECFMPLTYGGGIRTVREARQIFALGVEKIAVNSAAIERPEFISELADAFGAQSVIVAIDVKHRTLGGYTVMSHGGKGTTRFDPVTYAQRVAELGAGELMINSIDRDGTYDGYDLDLIKKINNAVDLPVIALGGAGSLDDVAAAVNKGGASAAAAGSLFVYQNKGMGVLINFPTPDEIKAHLGEGEMHASVHSMPL